MSRLLLIDDDPALIPEQVRQVFPAPAYEVVVASDGTTGLDQIRRQPPDVALLDMRLPDGSGLDVYERIRLATSMASPTTRRSCARSSGLCR